MFRRYSLILVMLAVMGAGGYAGYYLIWGQQGKTETALSFVPSEACLVVTGNDLFELRKQLENSSLFWQDIRNTGSELLSPGFLDLGCNLYDRENKRLSFAWALQAEGRASVACMLAVVTSHPNVGAWTKKWKKTGYLVEWKNDEKTSFTLQSTFGSPPSSVQSPVWVVSHASCAVIYWKHSVSPSLRQRLLAGLLMEP